ncbi:helix-turn-helix domain-containing protein [Halobacteria archaeon AArc-dxtr1]|nr:helix-turn-helix domain-containing protein [Halobacteria archaeon AArc-dxtr1]
MAIIAEFTVPANALPFESVLEAESDTQIELERIVPANGTAMPFFWAFGCPPEEITTAADEEPEIAEIRILATREEGALFEAKWTPQAEIVNAIKTLQPTIMDATADENGWWFQIRAANRDRLATFQRIFTDQAIPVELERIYEFSEEIERNRPLTPDQRETLVTAYEDGYFAEPREVTQQDLATQFDISSRAVSNRLRRATRNLVESALMQASKTDRSE